MDTLQEYRDVRLCLITIFLMQVILALHSFTRHAQFITLLMIWMSFNPFFGKGHGTFASGPRLAMAAVLGDAIGYFIVVPWELFYCGLVKPQYGIEVTFFVRVFVLVLSVAVYRYAIRVETSASAEIETPIKKWTFPASAFIMLIALSLIQNVSIVGHKPYYHRLAEEKAAAQLGPDYAGYRYFLNDIDLVFRTGRSTTIKAHLWAYNAALSSPDIEEVRVVWQEPWNQPRSK